MRSLYLGAREVEEVEEVMRDFDWSGFIKGSLSYYHWSVVWDFAYGWIDRCEDGIAGALITMGGALIHLLTIVWAFTLLIFAYLIGIVPLTIKMIIRTPKRFRVFKKEKQQ